MAADTEGEEMTELHLYPCPICGGTIFRVSISVGKVIGFECQKCGKVLPKEHGKKRRPVRA